MIEGRHDRPWSPAHLRVRADADGLRLGWTPRRRTGGDGWGPEGAPPAGRWRVRLLDGDGERRVIETTAPELLYEAALLAEDWPDGPQDAVVAVSEWGEGFGWGAEARCALV